MRSKWRWYKYIYINIMLINFILPRDTQDIFIILFFIKKPMGVKIIRILIYRHFKKFVWFDLFNTEDLFICHFVCHWILELRLSVWKPSSLRADSNTMLFYFYYKISPQYIYTYKVLILNTVEFIYWFIDLLICHTEQEGVPGVGPPHFCQTFVKLSLLLKKVN